MASRFLAIHEQGNIFIEDNMRAIHSELVNDGPVKYYPITLDENDVPTIGGVVTLKGGPRAQVKTIERQELEADGQTVAAADVEVDV